jgi:hypothetical protein
MQLGSKGMSQALKKVNASIDFGRGTNRFSRLIIGEDLFQRD